MKTAILLLTCGRVEETRKTWANNLPTTGSDCDLYWWDNTQDTAERDQLLEIAANYQFKQVWHALQNSGISVPFNMMMGVAFEDGCDFIVTMANDILEPKNWVRERVETAVDIPSAGVVAVPLSDASCARYDRGNRCGHVVESGLVIGNWLIRRELYDAIGGFTLDYGNYGPIDLDYCFRAWQMGFETLYISDISAIHIGLNNEPEYQMEKEKLLADSWVKYRANIAMYRDGERLNQ